MRFIRLVELYRLHWQFKNLLYDKLMKKVKRQEFENVDPGNRERLKFVKSQFDYRERYAQKRHWLDCTV